MSVSKFNENVNNHQSLPDQPNLTSTELKQLFDKAPNDIKTYLNNVLTAEIDALISNIQSGKIDVSKIVNNLTTGGSTNVASAEMVKQLNNEKLGSNANAVSASKWQTARTIEIGGAMTGSASVDGSANTTINVTQNIETLDLKNYLIGLTQSATEFTNLQKSGKLVHIGFSGGLSLGDSSVFAWKTMGTLPTTHRPSKEIMFPIAINNTDVCTGKITTNGEIKVSWRNYSSGTKFTFNFSYYTA